MIAVNWTKLETGMQSNAFASEIGSADRPFRGNTAPGDAINFAVSLFDGSVCVSKNKVIDISLDGPRNAGTDPITARDNAASKNITINALVILPEVTVQYAQTNLITGDGFAISAMGFDDFSNTVRDKILIELG
eukprot:evm.model.NODE_31053_length_64317_cov_55.547771.1